MYTIIYNYGVGVGRFEDFIVSLSCHLTAWHTFTMVDQSILV